jgi:hypothetical protein
LLGLNPTKQQLERLKAAFKQVKAENDSILTKPDSHTFVHTKVYKEMEDARRCLIIGRKGAGKTALLLGYQNEHNDRYFAKASIQIKADNFPLEALFSFFYSGFKHSFEKAGSEITDKGISDLPAFVDPARIAAFAWKQSLICAAIFTTSERLMEEPLLPARDKKMLERARRIIARHMGIKSTSVLKNESGAEIVFSLLIYFFQSVQGVIDKALEVHTHEISVALAAITFVLGKRFKSKLSFSLDIATQVISDYFDLNQKRTLITLDKFDDFYDEFYRRSRKDKHAENRREFLLSLLQGLVLAARDISRDSRFRWLDAILTIPMDKFLELHLRERVDLENSYVLRLEWKPEELLDFVNRRIAYALELEPGKKDSAWEILFPFDVTNGRVREVKENSFLYIVRHSLWKPREIQTYLSSIFEMMDEARTPADEEMFRRVAKTESEKLIRQEFLEEFQSEYPGILKVLKKIENLSLKSVMPYEDLCHKLSGLSLFDDLSTPDEIMLRLFHTGVLGVRQVTPAPRKGSTDATVTQNKEEVLYRYCYNCMVSDPFTQGINVAFHPMFFEYLSISHTEKYVVNQLTWEMFES